MDCHTAGGVPRNGALRAAPALQINKPITPRARGVIDGLGHGGMVGHVRHGNAVAGTGQFRSDGVEFSGLAAQQGNARAVMR
jgi:hypothetical protein